MSCATPTGSTRGTFPAEVLANRRLCDEHYLLRLRVEGFPASRPGQFVQVQCRRPGELAGFHEAEWPEGRLPRLTQPELADSEVMLRRPFSLAGRRETDQGVEIEILYRTVGVGTRWLAGVDVGDPLSVLGPLGNAFAIREDKPLAALVGGGVGIPPMVYLAEALAAAGKQTVAFSGVRTKALMPLTIIGAVAVYRDGRPSPCTMEFSRHGVDAGLATDDGTLGHKGLVHEALSVWIDREGVRGSDLMVYSCGPEAMMRAVAQVCRARDIECQLALERHMACGMGTCQSCVVRIRDHSDRGWSYKLCCTDGPVFDATDVIW